MNLSLALQSCSNTIRALKAFPTCKPCNAADNAPDLFILESKQQQLEQSLLSCCLSTLSSLTDSIRAKILSFEAAYAEKVKERLEFIENRFAELAAYNSNERTRLIDRIEQLEKNGLTKVDKVTFNKEETEQLVRRLHSLPASAIHPSLSTLLRQYIVLEYPDNHSPDTETLLRIIGLCHSTNKQ